MELMELVVLYYPVYASVCQQFPLFTKYPGCSDLFYLKILSEQSDFISLTTAKYCFIVCTICHNVPSAAEVQHLAGVELK